MSFLLNINFRQIEKIYILNIKISSYIYLLYVKYCCYIFKRGEIFRTLCKIIALKKKNLYNKKIKEF